jgi:hypothetical protein
MRYNITYLERQQYYYNVLKFLHKCINSACRTENHMAFLDYIEE